MASCDDGGGDGDDGDDEAFKNIGVCFDRDEGGELQRLFDRPHQVERPTTSTAGIYGESVPHACRWNVDVVVHIDR